MPKPRGRQPRQRAHLQNEDLYKNEEFIGPLLDLDREYKRRFSRWLRRTPESKQKRKQQHEKLAANPSQPQEYKDAMRRYYLQRQYGMTLEQRSELLASQNGKCLLCEQATDFTGCSATSGAHIDHCHKTGKIRGILCARCNTTLGKFRECPDMLRKAAEYLEKHL